MFCDCFKNVKRALTDTKIINNENLSLTVVQISVLKLKSNELINENYFIRAEQQISRKSDQIQTIVTKRKN
jgi:hypothetical protein